MPEHVVTAPAVNAERSPAAYRAECSCSWKARFTRTAKRMSHTAARAAQDEAHADAAEHLREVRTRA